VQDYVRKTRPERPILDRLELPLIQLIAEGDYVMTSFVRPEKDVAGETGMGFSELEAVLS
jgi:hypothetical protein